MNPFARFPDDAALLAFVESHATLADAARELGVPRSNLFSKLKHARRRTGGQQQAAATDEAISADECGDVLDLTAAFHERLPPEEIVRRAGYDPKQWIVERIRWNQWPVAGKRSQGQTKSGRWKPEKLWSKKLLQVSLTLRRAAPKHVQDGLAEVLASWSASLPPLPSVHRSSIVDPLMLELSLVDQHFGKLAWAEETGENYDLKTAAEVFLAAADDLIHRAGRSEIGRIVLPLGNDFFNVDNWQGTTARGTRVDSTDDRFAKVFAVGLDAMRDVVLRCREIAPVEVLYIPGNHDPATSWYLCKTLAEFFRGSQASDVSVDLSPKRRKYRDYGNSLVGWTHGNTERAADLPLIMAQEAPEAFAKARFKTWHTGHFHKSKETRYTAGDTFNGVSVVILPSLCGTDSYHYDNGWSTPRRAAEAHLWTRDRGLACVLHHNL